MEKKSERFFEYKDCSCYQENKKAKIESHIVHAVVSNDKKCTTCHDYKPISEFSKDISKTDKLNPTCKSCNKASFRKYANSEHGFMVYLLNGARCSNEVRNNNGRSLEFTLTIEQLECKWSKQDGRCYYTNMLMQRKPHVNYKCSIERISNDLGYTDDNTVLVICETNTANQWSRDKFEHFFSGVLHPRIEFTDAQLQKPIRRKETIARRKWEVDENNNVLCHFCTEVQPRSNFTKKLSYGCSKCRTINRRTFDSTWWGAVNRLYTDAQTSAKRRRMGFLLELQDIINQLKQQGGLCYYSGVTMSSEFGNYKVSLERVNVLNTYTKNNIVLCCQEFNSSDRTRLKTADSNDGCAGWSREKYQEVFLNSKRNNNEG